MKSSGSMSLKLRPTTGKTVVLSVVALSVIAPLPDCPAFPGLAPMGELESDDGANLPRQLVRFYRAWSSQAAGLALAADQPAARTRCAHSASIWTLIADALGTGKKGEVE